LNLSTISSMLALYTNSGPVGSTESQWLTEGFWLA